MLDVSTEGDSRPELICQLFEMAGATVLCVESVALAMEGVYQSFDPDVVLTDFTMPGADGFDLIREFRQAGVGVVFCDQHASDVQARQRTFGSAQQGLGRALQRCSVE